MCKGSGYFQQGPNQLEIHRKIPKKGYGDLSNLLLAHHDCNSAHDPRGRGRFNPLRSKTLEDVEQKKINTVEMMKHLNAFTPFCRWLVGRVKDGNVIAGKNLLNDAAWKFGVTQQTIQRYVDAITSDEGPLRINEALNPPRIVVREEDGQDGLDRSELDEETSRRAVDDSVG